MKKAAIALMIMISLASCSTYQTYVSVEPITFVPDGSREITLKCPLESFLATLSQNSIFYNLNANGAETEEILLDEGTRAVYKIYEVDSIIKIIPYWGVTQKVINEVQIWGGYQAASMVSRDLQRVIYDSNAQRPKRVFDYGVQLAKHTGQYYIN